MIKQFSSFLFESTNEEFSRTFNNNLSISFENLTSLIDLVPERQSVGTEEYEQRRKEIEKKRFNDKKSFYSKLANAKDLESAMNLAVSEASKYYNAIKSKLDPNRQTRAEIAGERKGREISLPGLEYKPAPLNKAVLEREPIAKYFLEAIQVLQDISQELKKPEYAELNTSLLDSFKSYFLELSEQNLQESEAKIFEAKKDKLNYLALFDDLMNVVESYKARLMTMISTMNSILKGVDPGSPLLKYQGFKNKLFSYYDWLNDSSNFQIGKLEPKEQEKRITEIKDKVEEVAQILNDAAFPGGDYEQFIKIASKPSSLGLGQFDTMLSRSTQLIGEGTRRMARLQSIVSNMWKSVRMFKGFSASDIGTSISDFSNTISGAKASDLVDALEKKKAQGQKPVSKSLDKIKFPKIDSSDIKTDDVESFSRALSPITDYRKDLERVSTDEKAFTLSTRILGNENGLPNLRPMEERFKLGESPKKD